MQQIKRPGRPPIGDQPATGTIQIRVTPARKNRYVMAARAVGQKLSAWITRACDEKTEEKE